MIACTRRRTLTLEAPSALGRPAHLSAASGLVRLGARLYVVADDELSLGVFDVDRDAPGTLLRMLPGELPDGKHARKRVKPDFESLALLPAGDAWPHGALLALASASRDNRTVGVVLALDAAGVAREPRRIDLAGFFAPLRARMPALNIEGAVVAGDELLLFQRGNKAADAGACLRFDFAAFGAGLARGAVDALEPRRVDAIELGAIDSIALGISDACALPDGRIVFCAVAEDTDDAYLDGAFRGAALGLLDARGTLLALERLDAPAKVEGIDARATEAGLELLLVTDADDAAVPGLLLEARWNPGKMLASDSAPVAPRPPREAPQ